MFGYGYLAALSLYFRTLCIPLLCMTLYISSLTSHILLCTHVCVFAAWCALCIVITRLAIRMFSETLPTHSCMPLHVFSLRPYDILRRTSVCVAVSCITLQCTVYVVSSTCIPASRPALLFALQRAATYYRISAATRCNTLQCTVYVVFSTYIPALQPVLLVALQRAAIYYSTSGATRCSTCCRTLT